MREFANQELFRMKCPICGCLNKKYVPIMYKHVQFGYAIHCCNCGHVEQFIEPPKSLGGLYNGHFMAGEEKEQRCYALNECPHKNCLLYGTYKADDNSGYDDEQNGTNSSNSNAENTFTCVDPQCPWKECHGSAKCMKFHLGVLAEDNSNSSPTQLDIKVENDSTPKFL